MSFDNLFVRPVSLIFLLSLSLPFQAFFPLFFLSSYHNESARARGKTIFGNRFIRGETFDLVSEGGAFLVREASKPGSRGRTRFSVGIPSSPVESDIFHLSSPGWRFIFPSCRRNYCVCVASSNWIRRVFHRGRFLVRCVCVRRSFA